MTQADNKALVARYFDQVLTRGDIAALDDLLAPGFRSWLPNGSSVGAGPYRDAVLASRQAFPDLAVTVLDQVAEADRVATRWQARGTHRGAFAGVPATGRPVMITASSRCWANSASVTPANGSVVEPAAIVCDWSRVGRESVVGAGACVEQRAQFPARTVLDGFPAQVAGTLDAAPPRPSWALTREALQTLVRL